MLIDWSSYTINKIGGDLFYEFLIEKKYFSQPSVHGYTSSVYRLIARFITNDEPEFYIVELLPRVDSENINLFYTSVEDFSGMAYIYNSKGQKVSIESYENGVLQTKRLDGSVRDLITRIPQKCDVLEGLEPTSNCGGGGGCTTSSVVVQRWTYWYDVEVDTQTGAIVSARYSHRQYRGSYVKQVTTCSGSAGSQGNAIDKTIIPVSSDGEVLNLITEFLIIKDASFKNSKADCVYEILKESNGDLFKSTIGKFIDDPKYALTFKIGNCVSSDDACTDGSKIGTTGELSIIIENTNANSINTAAMILHEGIHAELFRFVDQAHNGDVDPNDRPRLFELYNYYQRDLRTMDSNAQHVYMVENYVVPIAKAMRELDNNKYSLDYYMGFGWDGLRAYDYFGKLSSTDSDRFYQLQNTVVRNTSFKNCD
ncbi:hypothetical protein M0D21_21700 [Aquimarina sp. D1M17]|uniref:hypothetical protein n=1 Tax=Aquimarina acroporae TaxID=2937283 RepID=UPI0020BF8695|nr:hypothetical protein [Aquimarina acroporae]MCK8524208.1 hypothetical protein [Aquimarina acroporae]